MPKLFKSVIDIRSQVPAELESEEALLSYLGLSPEELKKIWWFREGMYQTFNINKSEGKERVINAPDERLKYLQRKIAILLEQIYRVRNPVHGFVSEKSVKTNAAAHMRSRFVLNMDLKDFFPSITENRVVGVLKSVGVDNRVAEIVARICSYYCYLPQGAPTSPIISNMICFRLDKHLMRLAKENHCIYTRYADDITFSSYQPMVGLFEGMVPPAGRLSMEQVAPKLNDIFFSNGFKINSDKIHYADRNSRRMVTGLKVNEFINVDRRYIRNIRATLHSVKKSGREVAQKRYEDEYGGEVDISSYLLGKISWLRFIRGQSDPVFRSIANLYNELFPDAHIEIMPTVEERRDRSVWVIEYSTDSANGLVQNQGSCFFVNGVGLVTAAHCVIDNGSPVSELEVYHPTKYSNKFKVTVDKFDEQRDLAIINHSIPDTEYYELEISNKVVKIGQDLSAVGYPGFGPGDSINVRNGTVSSQSVKSAVRFIEVTQKLAQGMSGGPLLDSASAIVGIIHKGGPSEARDFAVHVNELKKWLK